MPAKKSGLGAALETIVKATGLSAKNADPKTPDEEVPDGQDAKAVAEAAAPLKTEVPDGGKAAEATPEPLSVPDAGPDKRAESAAFANGEAQGAAAERKRITAIFTSDEAVGREAAAGQLALYEDLSAESSIAVLGRLNKGSPQGDPKSDLDAAMQDFNADLGGAAPENNSQFKRSLAEVAKAQFGVK